MCGRMEKDMKKYNIAVVGATGMVGRTFLKVLEEMNLPAENYYLFASARSAGKTLKFMGKDYVVEELNEHSFDRSLLWLFSHRKNRRRRTGRQHAAPCKQGHFLRGARLFAACNPPRPMAITDKLIKKASAVAEAFFHLCYLSAALIK